MVHADNEGSYVPQDVEEPIGGEVGSSPRLLSECPRLASILEIPEHLGPASDELWEAADAPGGDERRRRFGVESFTCVCLRDAARTSVARGALLVFH